MCTLILPFYPKMNSMDERSSFLVTQTNIASEESDAWQIRWIKGLYRSTRWQEPRTEKRKVKLNRIFSGGGGGGKS